LLISSPSTIHTKTFLIDKNENILWESEDLTENPLIWKNIVSGFLLLLNNHEVIKIGIKPEGEILV
jgi:hypothetical protein